MGCCGSTPKNDTVQIASTSQPKEPAVEPKPVQPEKSPSSPAMSDEESLMTMTQTVTTMEEILTSRESMEMQEGHKSEINSKMLQLREEMSAIQVVDEDELYRNDSMADPIDALAELFSIGSVWTGIAEWAVDKSSLALEITVLRSPNEENDYKFSVSRLVHVRRGRTREVNDVQIYLENPGTSEQELVFEYREDTVEGLKLELICHGRRDDHDIHIRRRYLKGMARKQYKLSETDTEIRWLEGTFDFVRTYAKQRSVVKGMSLDFDNEYGKLKSYSSKAQVVNIIFTAGQQFSKEYEEGRSTMQPVAMPDTIKE